MLTSALLIGKTPPTRNTEEIGIALIASSMVIHPVKTTSTEPITPASMIGITPVAIARIVNTKIAAQ